MSRNSFSFPLLSLLLIVGLIMVACVPAAPPAEEATVDSTSEAEEVAETAELEQVLRFGHSQTLAHFSPLDVVNGLQIYIQKWTFSKLIQWDRNGEIIPDLAESYTVSDDGTVYTFTLRQDVKWHDGEPFDAEDVVFTFNYLLNPDAGARMLSNFQIIEGAAEYGAGEMDAVSGVQATGEYEVQITLTDPSAVFLVDMLHQTGPSIMPEHVVGQIPPAEFETSDFRSKRPYPGTGPFVFDRYETDRFIELSAYSDYHRGGPIIDRIRFDLIPDSNTRIVALENGEVDLIMDIPEDEFERLSGVEGITMITQETPTVQGTFVESDQTNDDPKKVAIRQPQFRQALVHAVDMDSLINGVMLGLVSRQSCIFIQEWACPDDLVDYAYDPDRARALLEEIGWDESWEVDWMVLATEGGVEPVHAIIQQMYADVGINAVPRPVDIPTFIQDFYENGDFDVTWVPYGAGPDPNVAANNFLVCGQLYPNGYNGARYCNDRVTELVKAGTTVIDQAERATIYQEIATINNEELPLIAMWRGLQTAAVRDNVDLQYEHYNWDDVNLWSMSD